MIVTNFLESESLVLIAMHIGQFMMFLETANKTNVILCSVTFYLYVDGLFKVRAFKIGYPLYFRLPAAFFYKRCRVSMTRHRLSTEHKG